MNKALIIQARPGVGDFCIFIPYIQQILEHNKNYDFTLLTKKRSSGKHILKYQKPNIQIIYLEDEILKLTNSKIKNFFKLISFIKKNNFNKIYIMHFSLFWCLVAKVSRVATIYNYGIFKKNVNIYLNALEHNKKWLNKENLDSQTFIPYPDNKVKNHNQIIIGIGSSGPTRKWPTENYIELIKRINNNNIKFFLAGGNNEIEKKIAKQIQCSIKNNSVESLSDLTIEEMMPILHSSKLYIGNDTGFMHLCAGLNVPSISLFGDTPVEAYGRYTKNILPILPENFKTIGHNSNAINKITVEQVINKIKEFI
jgi:heptosyltransferase-2